MTATKTVSPNPATHGMPVWQTQPCPAWCVLDHADSDHPADRDHWGPELAVPMSLAPAVELMRGEWTLATWKVYLRQPQDGAPYVRMYNDDRGVVELDFTPDEARQFVEALQRVLGQIGAAR